MTPRRPADTRFTPTKGSANTELCGDGLRENRIQSSALCLWSHILRHNIMAVHGHKDSRREQANRQKTLREILQPIAVFKAQRRHGSGHHDRDL
jgi:hypothetical protein